MKRKRKRVPILTLAAGQRVLTADEACHRIITGDHAAGAQGSVPFDTVVVELLRQGRAVALYTEATNEIAFTVPEAIQAKDMPPSSGGSA